jgi:hypothetical protein
MSRMRSIPPGGLRPPAGGPVFLIPEFLVLFVGLAGRQGAVYQDNPSLYDLDGVGRGRHELLQYRFHERHAQSKFVLRRFAKLTFAWLRSDSNRVRTCQICVIEICVRQV